MDRRGVDHPARHRAVCVLLAFHPLINTKLFSDFKTDRLQMILIGLIPFTLILIGAVIQKNPDLVSNWFCVDRPHAAAGLGVS